MFWYPFFEFWRVGGIILFIFFQGFCTILINPRPSESPLHFFLPFFPAKCRKKNLKKNERRLAMSARIFQAFSPAKCRKKSLKNPGGEGPMYKMMPVLIKEGASQYRLEQQSWATRPLRGCLPLSLPGRGT